MNTTQIAQLKAVYQPGGKVLPLNEISPFGRHVSTLEVIKRSVLFLLHGNAKYIETTFHRDLVDRKIVNVKGKEKVDEVQAPKGHEKFFEVLNEVITKHNATLAKTDSWEIAKTIDAFSQLKEGDKDWATFFPEWQKAQKAQQVMRATTFASRELGNGGIFEPVCFATAYLCEIYPAIHTSLPFSDVLFQHFWAFMIAGAVAEVSVLAGGGFLKGAWSKMDSGTPTEIFKAGIAGMCEAWNARVADENSFHPLVDIAIGSLWISVTWLGIAKIQKQYELTKQLGTVLSTLCLNFVLNYGTMHGFFAFKGAAHKEGISMNAVKVGLQGAKFGAFRGVLKNFMNLPIGALDGAVKTLQGILGSPFCLADGVKPFLEYTQAEALYQAQRGIYLLKGIYDIVITNISIVLAALYIVKKLEAPKQKTD